MMKISSDAAFRDKPTRGYGSHVIAVCAMVTWAILSFTVWWSTRVGDQDAVRRVPHQRSSAPSSIDRPSRAADPITSAEYPYPVRGSSAGIVHVKPAPKDLIAAIVHAQAEEGKPTLSSPIGQSSWKGMPPEEAAKVFENAVKAASNSSATSPFRDKEDERQAN